MVSDVIQVFYYKNNTLSSIYAWLKTGYLLVLVAIPIGLLMPENLAIPVQGATRYDWNKHTFWNDRWGRSGVHKGIDIFAARNRAVNASATGIVIYKGKLLLGGNVVAVLGPKWRIHYYAHLNRSNVHLGSFVYRNEKIGTIGTSGNARGKPPHLHYSILTLVPYPWRIDFSKQGWKKMFFLNPSELLLNKS